jgi:hypothetical protein
MVDAAFATSKERSTGAAAVNLPSPCCDARTVTLPAPVIVTMLPDTVAGQEITLKLTGSPDEAVATSAKGGSPKVLPASAPKLMV